MSLTFFQMGYVSSNAFVETVSGWRFMYASSIPVSLIMGIGMWWLPPSPRWLLLCSIDGKDSVGVVRETALSCLCRLRGTSQNASKEIDAILADISSSGSEKEEGFRDIFEGKCLKALIIGVGLVFFQQACLF